MIDINIEKAWYGKKGRPPVIAVEGLRLQMETGGCLVVVGESGSGKSTVLKVICGLHRTFQGHISIDGEAVSGKSLYYMPQKSALLPWLTIYDNIAALRRIKERRPDKNRLLTLMSLMDIESLKNRYPSQISGGEAQRAALVSALYFEPHILLMDEPFSSLDEITRGEIQQGFREARKMFSISTVFVTHSIEEALILGDRVAVLKKPPDSLALTVENAPQKDSYQRYRQAEAIRKVMEDEKG